MDPRDVRYKASRKIIQLWIHKYRIRTKWCRISKISNEVERIDNCRDLVKQLSFLPTEFDIFYIQQHCVRILFIFQRLVY